MGNVNLYDVPDKNYKYYNPRYIQEKVLREHPESVNKKNLKRIIEQMEKSICKIKCNDGSIGTGFFCKIPFPDNSKLLPVLITNSHVLSRNDLLKDSFINISLDDDKYEYKIYIDESHMMFPLLK
jgi:hypothetical protein